MSDNWKNASLNRRKAHDWVRRMEEEQLSAIEHSIQYSKKYLNFVLPDIDLVKDKDTVIHVVDMTAEDAVMQYAGNGKTCILNFASYKNPGGRFYDGDMAQEEALCHVSTLYPVLRSFTSEYSRRLSHLNNGLYNEDFIYSPDIIFFKDGKMQKCDVLTYAAPNMMRKAKTKEYHDVLCRRMLNAFVIPYLHGCENVILGAWGCGVFCNNPITVAEIWKLYEDGLDGLYSNIVHPVPTMKGTKNYDAFMRVHIGG